MARGRVYQRGKDGKELPERARWGTGKPYIQFTLGGKRIRRPIEARTKGEAEVILAEAIAEERRKQKKIGGYESDHEIGALVHKWRKQANRNKQDFDRVMRIVEYIGESQKIREVRPPAIVDWIEHRKTEVRENTARRDLTPLSSFFRWAVGCGHCDANPVRDIPKPSDEFRSPEPLTKAEITELFEAVRGHALEPVCYLGYWAGLRRGEICRIERKHFSDDGLFVPGTKTKNSAATIPILPPLREYLERHEWQGRFLCTQIRNPSEPWLPNGLSLARERWNKRARKEGGVLLPGYHRLRHSIGAHLMAERYSITAVAKFLRDTELMIEKVYGHTKATDWGEELSKFSI